MYLRKVYQSSEKTKEHSERLSRREGLCSNLPSPICQLREQNFSFANADIANGPLLYDHNVMDLFFVLVYPCK